MTIASDVDVKEHIKSKLQLLAQTCCQLQNMIVYSSFNPYVILLIFQTV